MDGASSTAIGAPHEKTDSGPLRAIPDSRIPMCSRRDDEGYLGTRQPRARPASSVSGRFTLTMTSGRGALASSRLARPVIGQAMQDKTPAEVRFFLKSCVGSEPGEMWRRSISGDVAWISGRVGDWAVSCVRRRRAVPSGDDAAARDFSRGGLLRFA